MPVRILVDECAGPSVARWLLAQGHEGGGRTRKLFLAVSDDVWNTLFQEPIGETALQHGLDRVICFDPAEERIIR